jgi:hypothetical protein
MLSADAWKGGDASNRQDREPNWPVAVLSFPHGRADHSPRQTMAICVGYFEGNDSRDTSGRFTVAGFVAPKARWRFFEDRWSRALHAEGVAAFNGRDFVASSGEYAGWKGDGQRRARLMETLSRLTDRHVMAGFSCSIQDDAYEDLNHEYRFAETASGPYGVCAGLVMARVQRWMAAHHPDDQTLFVFEDGDLDHREVRRVLHAQGIDRGEPPQMWPRRWRDEQGRRRVIRPFEACDLLLPACNSRVGEWLSARDAFTCEGIGLNELASICTTLGVPTRSQFDRHDVAS